MLWWRQECAGPDGAGTGDQDRRAQRQLDQPGRYLVGVHRLAFEPGGYPYHGQSGRFPQRRAGGADAVG
jgi:hypothetical protein